MISLATQGTTDELAAVRNVLQQGRRDPVSFIEIAAQTSLWDVQRQIIRSIFARPRARVAVKACHASGKTYVAALTLLAFFYLNPGCKILTTAPTWTGVKKLLWSEVHAAHAKFPHNMGGELLDVELRAGRDWWAMGLSTNEGVKFQGHHGGTMLLILDEAPGVRPDIFEAIEGIRAGGDVRVLALGNPTIASGPFHNAFTTERANWDALTIDAFDTPNLAGVTEEMLQTVGADDPMLDICPRPYLVTRRWVHEKITDWGIDSPLYQSRVRGAFPLQSEDALISLAWLEAARYREDAPGNDLCAGVDVSGPGEDETVLVVREGGRIIRLEAWSTADSRGDVLSALAPYRERNISVNVDSIGIGYYMAQHIRDAGYTVREINVGESASDTEKYANAKAEHYWGLRMRFQSGEIGGLTDERAVGQLAGIRYRHNARGQIVIESKDEARKRGVKSPDRAEAVMLAFAVVPEGPELPYAYRRNDPAYRAKVLGTQEKTDEERVARQLAAYRTQNG